MDQEPPPPPPPPHGQNPRPPGGLPDGNYDIFIIPPHSAGSGFLYLPSLQGNRNAFLAGVACALLAVGVYSLLVPVVKQWLSVVSSGGGGLGVVVLVIAVGVGAWAWGKTQSESSAGGPRGGHPGDSGAGARQQNQYSNAPPPNYHAPPPQSDQHSPPPPQPEPQSRTRPSPSAGAWEKAREETRKREEERKRAEELKRKREEAQKAREEAEKAAKAKAEKEKWEQSRAREKEQREREARERIARERLAREKEAREKDAREREAREAAEKEAAKKKAEWEKAKQAEKEKAEKARSAASARSSPTKPTSPSKSYEKPSARSQAGTEAYSYRPYDTPKAATYKSSASSISGLSESSYAPSHSTARTTPPPSHRGPYSTDDPEKIQIKAVYLFSDSFPMKPISQLVSGQGNVTDGLILRIKTEGLFIDDDVRGVPQREWDVKAWTLKHVEDGATKMVSGKNLHVLRATTRDAENKKYTFVLDETEAYKVAMGLQRLRKGSQVRSLGVNGIKDAELKGLLMSLGWM